MNGPLTESQLTFFRANGFVHIPRLLSPADLAGVQRDTDALIKRGIDTKVNDETYKYGADAKDGDRTCLYRINELIRVHGHESFKLLLAHPNLLAAISQAVGGDHFAAQVHSCVFKIPHRGYPVPWHQDPVDVYCFPVFNVDVYLDEADTDNGCLYVIPGSHLGGYHGTPGFVHQLTEGRNEDAPDAIAIRTQPGDVLFHSTSVLHGSWWNRGRSLRRTIYFHINHYQDIRHRPPEDGHRAAYLGAEDLMIDAIAQRKIRFPDEEAFDYRPIDPTRLEAPESASA